MHTTLVVMAAGMGSRFGGLKQTQPITADGKGLLDFTVYDAQNAGFDKVVFIVREDMLDDFKSLVGNRISEKIRVEYAIQNTDLLPVGREKPFGTAHAVLCTKNLIHEPFVIVNADDYYGKNAFFEIHEHLVNAKPGEYAMSAFLLENTLSENGTVSRGVCSVENGFLTSVKEVTAIEPDGSFVNAKGDRIVLDPKTPVSMNIWGLTPDIFDVLEKKFDRFLKTANLSKDEFYIPTVISETVEEGKASVRVYFSTDKWFGMTYREDLEQVKNTIGGYINDGLYKNL